MVLGLTLHHLKTNLRQEGQIGIDRTFCLIDFDLGIKNILLNTSTSNGPISVDIWKQYFKNVFLPAFVFIAYPNLDHLATSKVPFAKPYFKCLAGDHIAHLNDFLRTRMGIFFTLMMQQGY